MKKIFLHIICAPDSVTGWVLPNLKSSLKQFWFAFTHSTLVHEFNSKLNLHVSAHHRFSLATTSIFRSFFFNDFKSNSNTDKKGFCNKCFIVYFKNLTNTLVIYGDFTMHSHTEMREKKRYTIKHDAHIRTQTHTRSHTVLCFMCAPVFCQKHTSSSWLHRGLTEDTFSNQLYNDVAITWISHFLKIQYFFHIFRSM